MSSIDDILPPEPGNVELLAAEYVLGVLDPPTRRMFAARVARDAALAREVACWQRRLSPWADDFEEVAPPPGLWPRVRARVGLSPPTPRAATPSPPLWERLAFWRGVGFAGIAATAASLLALALLPRTLPMPDPHSPLPHPLRLVATASDPAGTPVLMAAVDDDACTMVLMPLRASEVPAGKVAEFWFVSADGRPHALGLGDRAPMQAIAVPSALRGQVLAEGTVAVSLEDSGGSRTGWPSAQVIARGKLTRL